MPKKVYSSLVDGPSNAETNERRRPLAVYLNICDESSKARRDELTPSEKVRIDLRLDADLHTSINSPFTPRRKVNYRQSERPDTRV